MEVEITDITDVEKEIRIQATAGELADYFEHAYRDYQPKVEIKGFRKGKVPLDLVKKIYGESIEYGYLDKIASNVYRQVVTERHIHPIGEPVLTDMDYKRGEALTFKVKYEIKPTIQVKEYTGIPVEKIVHTVTDKEVEDEINRLRRTNAVMIPAETVTDEEHIVTADIQQLDETGTPLIGKKTSDAQLYLSDESIYPQIKEALKEATVGSPRRATVEREQDGKREINHLEIVPKKIEKVQLPPFDDELVRTITKEKITDAAEFRKQMREDIERYWHDRSERRLMDSLIAEIVRRHDFPVPEALVKGFLDSMLEEIKSRQPNKKLPREFKEEEFREQNRGYAVFQAKWYLLRERIIEKEGLTVTEDDLTKIAETDAPRMGIEKERLLEFYKTSDAARDRILSEKLNSFLKDNAQIAERVTEGPID